MRLARVAALLSGLATAGCITLPIGGGVAFPPAHARDTVVPTFTFAPGAVLDLPHDVRPSDRDAPRLVRVALQLGASLTGARTNQGAVNSIAGPVILRTDVTFARLGRDDEILLRATAQVAGPGLGVDNDPVGAVGEFDVPHASAWAGFGGGTLEVVTLERALFLFSFGLGVHTFAGDRIEATTLWGPELLVAMDANLFRMFGRDD